MEDSTFFSYDLQLFYVLREFLFLTPFLFLLGSLHSYVREQLWNRGGRFLHKSSNTFAHMVNGAMMETLGITDTTFQKECYDTITKWIVEKQDTIINNMKLPYREKLKTCE